MIRPLQYTDLPQLLAIETATQAAPWSAETFQRCWEVKYPGWVIEQHHKIIGFGFISLIAEECHLLNLCIHPDHQRQGWGQQLLQYILTYIEKRGATMVYLEVRRSNREAIQLYEKMDFVQIGERKNYYHTVNGLEDALTFAKDLKIE